MSRAKTRKIGVVAAVAALALAVGVAHAGGAIKGSNYKFTPKTLTVAKDTKVVWKWVNGTHTVTFRKGTFSERLSKAHPKVTRTFRKAGTFRYYCKFHEAFGMTGKVIVE